MEKHANIQYLLFFKGYKWRYLSLENADHKQSNFAIILKNFEKSTKILEKKSFLNNLGLLFSAREKVANSFKSRLFLIKYLNKTTTCEPTPEPATEPEVAKEPATEPIKATKAAKVKTKRKISSLNLCEKFLNEIIKEEKNINEQI